MTSLDTLPAFLAACSAGLLLFVAALFLFLRLTPLPELRLIREGNEAAALALGGAMLGLALPLASAIAHSISLVDLLVWGAIALVVQLASYAGIRLAFPDLSDGIAAGRRASGLVAAATALAFGLINAASMTP